ncbi:MAG: SIR2 family protein, partial [Planctomycetota bacterium]
MTRIVALDGHSHSLTTGNSVMVNEANGSFGQSGSNVFENAEFIGKLVHDADVGYSFVPLVGSGMSSPSGIIMGMEFTNYLAFVTYLILADPAERKRTHGEGQPARWNLLSQGWPPLPSESETEAAEKWIRNQFTDLCQRLGMDVNHDGVPGDAKIRSVSMRDPESSLDLANRVVMPRIPSILLSREARSQDDRFRRLITFLASDDDGEPRFDSTAFSIDDIIANPKRSYRQRIEELGIRSLHDWRETLVFLASVKVCKGDDQRDRLRLGRRNPATIDAFNQFITRDKQPNLGHKMLAHLSGPLRIQTVLTTNFDTLTETAYRALGLPIRVLPVSTRGKLPEARIVAAGDSIVKLHGEAQNTRADLTLDDEPSRADLATFNAYLTRGEGNLQAKYQDARADLRGGDVPPIRPEAKRLLVLGYSGSDHRCVQMIKNWLENGPQDSLLYWVCFSTYDVAKVRSLFSAQEYQGKIRVTRSARPDLLLYELYQRLVLSLTPGGLTYEFSQSAAPQRLGRYDTDYDRVQRLLECVGSDEDPLVSARQLLGGTTDLDEARKLCRDAVVADVKELIQDLVEKEKRFYQPDGTYKPAKSKSGFGQASLWRPTYRVTDPEQPT